MLRLLLVAGTLLFVIVALTLGAGARLSAPAARSVGPPPAGWDAEPVSIAEAPGEAVAGWFLQGEPGHGCVLLLHGIRSDRRQMLGRAAFLHAAGHCVMLIDLPAHGESTGARIAFGHREARAVATALRQLRQRMPQERIGVVGVSLGAVAFVLAEDRPAVHAVVLESMVPTLHEAVSNRLRMRWGEAGTLLTPLLLGQMPLWLGVGADRLRPIDRMDALGAPVFIVSGTRDRHTTIEQTRRLHAAATPPKLLWEVDGAGHVDLHAFARSAYETRLLAFFRAHLRTLD